MTVTKVTEVFLFAHYDENGEEAPVMCDGKPLVTMDETEVGEFLNRARQLVPGKKIEVWRYRRGETIQTFRPRPRLVK
jgi:hypothetical protein